MSNQTICKFFNKFKISEVNFIKSLKFIEFIDKLKWLIVIRKVRNTYCIQFAQRLINILIFLCGFGINKKYKIIYSMVPHFRFQNE